MESIHFLVANYAIQILHLELELKIELEKLEKDHEWVINTIYTNEDQYYEKYYVEDKIYGESFKEFMQNEFDERIITNDDEDYTNSGLTDLFSEFLDGTNKLIIPEKQKLKSLQHERQFPDKHQAELDRDKDIHEAEARYEHSISEVNKKYKRQKEVLMATLEGSIIEYFLANKKKPISDFNDLKHSSLEVLKILLKTEYEKRSDDPNEVNA